MTVAQADKASPVAAESPGGNVDNRALFNSLAMSPRARGNMKGKIQRKKALASIRAPECWQGPVIQPAGDQRPGGLLPADLAEALKPQAGRSQ
ncbi:MAG: hypothetical protein FD153_169 [Rhodospirillaceae bacterium]|nr:MAG: hypothetical protein FD153_169 [Rhodospirillaceae bacterium]